MRAPVIPSGLLDGANIKTRRPFALDESLIPQTCDIRPGSMPCGPVQSASRSNVSPASAFRWRSVVVALEITGTSWFYTEFLGTAVDLVILTIGDRGRLPP